MANRLINEAAVEALINTKIDALSEKIERAIASPNEQTNALLAQYHAQIGALRVTASHLRFIETATVGE